MAHGSLTLTVAASTYLGVNQQTMYSLSQYIPSFVKRALRVAYYFSVDSYQSITRTQKIMTPPAMTSFLVGRGDFHAVGKSIKDSLLRQTNLNSESIVLEIGCGYGRVAVALTELLSPNGHYNGMDVVEAAVDWCAKEISSRYPNFKFFHANVSNAYANGAHGIDAIAYKLPFADNTYDLVFLTAVFSHMRPEEIRAYLQEIYRVLKPGAACYATYFLTDDFVIEQIANNRATPKFKHDFGNFLSINKRVPEKTIAIRESLIRDYYRESGLSIREPISYGCWANRPHCDGYQDVIVATK